MFEQQLPRTTLLTVVALGLFAASSSADLIVHYEFNGNALDSSGLGNNGTIFGNPTFVAGQTEQAIYFDNPVGQQVATQYVSLPDSAVILALQNSSFTIAINYLSNDASERNGRLLGGFTSGSGLVFNYNAGGVPETYFQMEDGIGGVLGTHAAVSGNPAAVTTDGQWHWGVVVFDRAAGELRQYVDATLVATVPFGTFGPVSFLNTDIGRDAKNTTFGARLTTVDDFMLYSHALTTAEVNQLVNAVPEPSSLVLVGIGMCGLLGLARRRRLITTSVEDR